MIRCWRCGSFFEADPHDIRPFLFCVCNAATRNPFFNSWRRGAPTGVDSRDKECRYDYRRRVDDR